MLPKFFERDDGYGQSSMIAPNIIQEVTVPYMNCNSSKSTMCYLSQLLMRGCSERERDRVLFEQEMKFEITAFFWAVYIQYYRWRAVILGAVKLW